jgi:hypothetical protein
MHVRNICSKIESKNFEKNMLSFFWHDVEEFIPRITLFSYKDIFINVKYLG